MMTDSKGHEEGRFFNDGNKSGMVGFAGGSRQDFNHLNLGMGWHWQVYHCKEDNGGGEEGGEAYFYDVVIAVSVPQSEDDVPNMREQPTSPDSKMAYVARIPAQETFEEEFAEEKRKKIEFRPLLKATAKEIKTGLKIPKEREEIERRTRPLNEYIGEEMTFEIAEIEKEAKEIQTGLEKISGRRHKLWRRAREEQKEKERSYLQEEIARIRREMTMEFDKQVKTVRDEGSKQLVGVSRRFEEAKMELSEERQRSLSERREYEEKIRRSEEEIQRLEEEIRRLKCR